MAETEIVDNAALHRFELQENGETAFILYNKNGNSIHLVHTEVPESLQGKGVGQKLVGGVLRFVRQQNLAVFPDCPFVADYLQRHHEYLPVVDAEWRRRIQSSE